MHAFFDFIFLRTGMQRVIVLRFEKKRPDEPVLQGRKTEDNEYVRAFRARTRNKSYVPASVLRGVWYKG
jgi:hypothetical protein